jgi:DNA-binding MarR family transcriptional regulator
MNDLEIIKKGIVNVLVETEKVFGTDVPVSMIGILLMIPLKGSMPVTKIRKLSTLTEAGVSRVLSTLNAHNLDHRRQVEKLIEIHVDDKDRRYRNVNLTRRGKDLVLKFMDHLLTGKSPQPVAT